ncbi:peptidylprolyl isomerase [Ehrlichia ruminantium]|uniref:Peptidylprolyl isomerase n=2 Tax=Ehrlichia ruminantium TaxID=779 RepID=A0AAE6UL59_EHRRU|nr:SurA N-terminal domain-containing protein [Ehrlichia ruminantium]QGR03003.1 peptidylprolyl isomerase [Ehrlichia ruminantium]QGR03928.1 peptidylprolyl isomerase [Ehrlichia ruminantium]QGR04850.1 peptidylprolyl isomerase [Ehrlichia ruminantium]
MRNHTIGLFFLLLIFYCTNAFANVKIVATVNGELISSLDLEKRVAINKFFYNLSDDTSEKVALDSLIDEYIWKQEAEKLKITVSEQEVLAAVNQLFVMRGSNHKGNNSNDFKSYVEQQGLDYDMLIQHIKSKLMWNKILMLKVVPYINVSNKEIVDSQESILSPNGLDIFAHIQEVVLPVNMNDDHVTNNVINDLRDGVNIENIKNRVKGSLFEEISVNVQDIDVVLANQLLNAKVGDVIGPVKTEYGNLIIKLLDKFEIGKEFANSDVDLWQIYLGAQESKKYFDQVSVLKTKAKCENFHNLAVELGLPAPSSFVTKVKDLSVKIQNKLQSLNVGGIVEVPNGDAVNIIMLCNVTKGKAGDSVSDINMIKQKLYMEKLEMQSEYLLSTMKKNSLIEKYN